MPLRTRRAAGGWATPGTSVGPTGPVGPPGPPGPSDYPLIPFTPIPPGLPWVWANPGAATSQERAGAIHIYWPPRDWDHLRAYVQPLTPGIASATIGWISANGNASGNIVMDGVAIAEAATGKYLSCCVDACQYLNVLIHKWTTIAAANASAAYAQVYRGSGCYVGDAANGTTGYCAGLFYVRFRFTATTYAIDFSYDGIDFRNILTEAKNAFFTTAPDLIGFAGGTWNAGAGPIWTTYCSWQET